MYKLLLFMIANFLLLLGVIGIVLPVIPTTPLLMASCYFYSKSSDRFNIWLINSTIYKKYAKDFVESRSLPLKRKIFILTFASTMLLFPLIILNGLLKIIILLIYIFLYYYFIFKIKTE